uniref:M20/M25/M40 family metallo-hydrolase n=1 Tax=Staphylococcus epidermidis TaxID=1282 RepID=UPI0028CB8EB4|nr:M20/M25/M40 family metallo-hydrolase [Staphylococcus epidermidis]
MSGEMDVVDAGEDDDWSFGGFEVRDKDGKLLGRGSSEMKGGVMGMVMGMIELKE